MARKKTPAPNPAATALFDASANPGDPAVALPQTPDFETLLSEAEMLARRMEEGGLTLDESLAAYEKGVGNLRLCAGLLRTAEDKVKLLLEKDGAFRLDDLDPDEDGDDTATYVEDV